jgi:hypothetical protein
MLAPGSTAIAPWVVTAGDVEGIGQYYWSPAAGLCSLSLNGDASGTIAQSFATVPGTNYAVSFSLSGDAFSASSMDRRRSAALPRCLKAPQPHSLPSCRHPGRCRW